MEKNRHKKRPRFRGRSDIDNIEFIPRKGSGNEASSRPESAEGALPTRGKQGVSRRFAAGTHLFILLSKQVEILIST